jgi:outer membrane lipoprotein-sorting protein
MKLKLSGRSRRGRGGLWMGAGILVVALLATAAETTANNHPIQSMFAPGLKDLSLTTVRKEIHIEELNKISRDYANAYRIGRSKVMLKEPDKFRMDARVGFVKFEYVMNGPRKVIRTPLTKQFDDIGTDPGKRLGPLEVGLVTPGALIGYDVEHVGCSTEEGRRVCEYKLYYAHNHERYELVWIDAERKCVKKRRLYTLMYGKYKMELTYSAPKQVGNLWIPTVIEVRNAEGKLAGITHQQEIKLNPGLDDSLFKI